MYARHIVAKASTSNEQSILIVAMPNTPDRADLPYVELETVALEARLPDLLSKRVLRNPERTDVVSNLRSCQIAHFACHGESSSVNPSHSCLLLKDWKTKPLSVADVVSLKLENAQLVYLSACHAAQNRDVRLFDEGIHIAAGFQLAGFPYVIGTLWQVSDLHSAEFAKNVYDWMLANGDRVDVSKSAEAVHHAARLKRRYATYPRTSRDVSDEPIIWASYIHLGL